MNAALFLIIGCAVLVVGYIFYGGWLAKKWGVDNSRPTPAHTMEDGKDYCPAKAPVLMGHHFSSIAGAGPINGPIQAAVFGWVPVMLWVLIGGIFFGGVHDFGALFASIRHKGESIGEVIGDAIGAKAKKLFIVFAYLTLILVVAAFASIVANTFKATYTADGLVDLEASAANASTAIISIMFILMAIIFGFFVYRRNAPLGISTIIGVIGIVACMVIGLNWHPIYLSYTVWMIIVGLYIGVASVTPVWILLQPRDYLSSFLLYGMMVLAVVGIIGAHPVVDMPAFLGFEDTLKPTGTSLGYMFPALFVTIACGAVSGFHSLVGSGTTSKQLDREAEAQPIGYGGMLLEGVVALLALLAVACGTQADLKTGLATLPPVKLFAQGLASFCGQMGLPEKTAESFMLLAVAAFLMTSVDACTRLARFVWQEIWSTTAQPSGVTAPGAVARPQPLVVRLNRNMYVATTIVVLIGIYLLVFNPSMSANLWTMFASANQMLASLTLLTASLWLFKKHLRWWIAFLPMCFMVLTSGTAVLQLFLDSFAKWMKQGFAAGGVTAIGAAVLFCLAVVLLVLGALKLRKLIRNAVLQKVAKSR